MLFHQRIDKEIQMLGGERCHGPLLLCWAAIRSLYPHESECDETRKFGNRALQLGVFDTILDIMDTDTFSYKTSVSMVVSCGCLKSSYIKLATFSKLLNL